MARSPVRLVHASNLHLERPLYGLSEVPQHLRELVRDAPLRAAEAVFETALTEAADAVLLSGDVIDPLRAGPRAVVFLVEQFKRLEMRGIPVFWAGGAVDPPDVWPRATPLPENVTVFPIGRIEEHDVVRDGKVVCRVQGVSLGSDGQVNMSGFHRDAHDIFTVGVAYATSDSAGKEGDRVDYMALGGRKRRATVDAEPGIAHYPGTPQGRCPAEAGPSGCTVVQVDEEGTTKTRFVSTDVVRFVEETLEFTASTTVDQLRARLRERHDKLRQKTKDVDQLVAWNLRGAGPLIGKLRPEGLCDELLHDLQKHDGRQSPACWSYTVRCLDPFELPQELLDQETILGDLLRQIEVFRRNEAVMLDIRGAVPKPLAHPAASDIGEINSHAEKVELLDRAAKLGIALMAE